MSIKCPTCGKASEKPHHPFCSERCASVDLGRWFAGKYAYTSSEPPDNEDMDAIIEALEGGHVTDGASTEETGANPARGFADNHQEPDHPQAQIMPFPRKPN